MLCHRASWKIVVACQIIENLEETETSYHQSISAVLERKVTCPNNPKKQKPDWLQFIEQCNKRMRCHPEHPAVLLDLTASWAHHLPDSHGFKGNRTSTSLSLQAPSSTAVDSHYMHVCSSNDISISHPAFNFVVLLVFVYSNQ
jgi:hypothetical protein